MDWFWHVWQPRWELGYLSFELRPCLLCRYTFDILHESVIWDCCNFKRARFVNRQNIWRSSGSTTQERVSKSFGSLLFCILTGEWFRVLNLPFKRLSSNPTRCLDFRAPFEEWCQPFQIIDRWVLEFIIQIQKLVNVDGFDSQVINVWSLIKVQNEPHGCSLDLSNTPWALL